MRTLSLVGNSARLGVDDAEFAGGAHKLKFGPGEYAGFDNRGSLILFAVPYAMNSLSAEPLSV
jgi:hypothetical protein